MHDVFISYSTLDSNNALDIREYLERNGISCWMAPRDIPSGSNYTKEIPAAIRGCQVFLLLLTGNAQRSQWVLKELDSAVNERKVVIPLMLDDAPLSDEFGFLLSGAQRHPACPLSPEALTSLLSRIASIVRPEETPEKKDTEWIPVTAFTDGEPLKAVCCPACKSTDLKEKPKKIRRHGREWLTLPLIPLCAVAALFLGIILLILVFYTIPDFGVIGDVYSAMLTLTAILSTAGGGWLGDYIGKELIRRRRIRHHLSVQEFRCIACSKNFHTAEQIR